ncbi:MAG: glucosaminidase domain-containing protein [Patescibacteria group bacterium]|nr:glucosaminidase domain-containing protein [Patescibacteria group bacterium]
MALTENQINDQFQSQLGRSATPYETSVYGNASPLALSSLKDTYARYNKDTSIVDYLKYHGQDPNTIHQLGSQYGISNIGTAEGNTRLLNMLKSGQQPPTPAPITGSIAPPPPPADTSAAPAGSNPPSGTNQAPSSAPPSGTSADIIGNQGTPDTTTLTPPQIPGLQDALTSYQNVQKQIAQIDNSIASALSDKRAEIARAGGIVNESQLQSEVAMEKQPLMLERSQLVMEQNNLRQAYSDLLAQQRESDTNFWKGVTTTQAQQKIGNQATQNALKIIVQGIESGSMTGKDLTTDEWNSVQAGNITPDILQKLQMKGMNVGITGALGITGSPTINSSQPGYFTDPVQGTLMTQAEIDQAALSYALTGVLPTSARSSTGVGLLQSTAIRNRSAELNTGGNIQANKAALKSDSSALTQQTEYLNNTQRALNTANDTLTALAQWMSDNGINPSQYPDYNKFVMYLNSKGIDPGAAGGYNAQISTLRAEYSQVLARGGQRSVETDQEAAKLIPDGLSPAELSVVADRIKVDATNVIKDAGQQISSIQDHINGLVGGGTASGSPSQSAIISAPEGHQYDMSRYAIGPDGKTDQVEIANINKILSDIGQFTSPQAMQDYIDRIAPNSPITADMVQKASHDYGVPWEMLVAVMQQESTLGTKGKGVARKNPGNINVGNNVYQSWQNGVNDMAAWLADPKKGSKGISPSGGQVSTSNPTTTKSGQPFDYAQAKAVGYTDQEIQDFINSN